MQIKNTILRITTRAMAKSRKQKEKEIEPTNKSRLDQPTMWHTDKPTEVEKLLKLKSTKSAQGLQFKIYNHKENKTLGSVMMPMKETNENGSQTLEFALLEICDCSISAIHLKILSTKDTFITNH